VKSKSTVKKSVVSKKARSVKSLVSAEHPEADVKHIVRGIVRRGLQPLAPKVPVTLRIDPDVLEWFKHEGDGYQTRMNAVLRAYRDAASA
jgi:uncharacterized protein (DUF4415 family)